MATRDKEKAKTSSNGHNRVEGFVFGIRLEGSEEVVTEGIKAFTHAIGKNAVILASAPVPKTALNAPKQPTTTVIDGEPAEDAPEVPTDGQAEELATEESVEANGNGKPKKMVKIKAPKFLSEPDLTTAGVPLIDFLTTKSSAPENLNDMEKYLLVAIWYKDQFGIEEITKDHIFTAYSHLGWLSKLPPNPNKPFQNAMQQKQWFESGKSGKGYYKVIWNGQDYVNKMAA